MKRYLFVVLPVLLLTMHGAAKAFPINNLHISATASPPDDDAKETINDIITVIGLKANFEVREGSIPNAAAVAYNGKRYIVYNPVFISKLNAAAGNKWASVSVLAHEIGHHLNGHTLQNVGSRPALELEADEFSGFILRKMGASLQQSQAAMKFAASYKPSLTHPGQKERLIAIAAGWNNAAGPAKDMAKYSQPVPQTVVAAPRPQQVPVMVNARSENKETISRNTITLESKYIFSTVDFPSDPAADYFVTIRYNLVKVVNNKLYVVGKLVPTNSADYPYIMTSNSNRPFYVYRYGRIMSANRRLAGFMKRTG